MFALAAARVGLALREDFLAHLKRTEMCLQVLLRSFAHRRLFSDTSPHPPCEGFQK